VITADAATAGEGGVSAAHDEGAPFLDELLGQLQSIRTEWNWFVSHHVRVELKRIRVDVGEHDNVVFLQIRQTERKTLKL
jgi:hypothetical protein